MCSVFVTSPTVIFYFCVCLLGFACLPQPPTHPLGPCLVHRHMPSTQHSAWSPKEGYSQYLLIWGKVVRIWRGGQDQGGHQCRWSWRDIGHHPFHYPLEAFRGQVDKVPIRYPDTQSVLLGSFLANLLLRLQCVSLQIAKWSPQSQVLPCVLLHVCTWNAFCLCN